MNKNATICKDKPDTRLRNTKLLLHRLGDMRTHIEESVVSTANLEALERAAEIKPLMQNRVSYVLADSIAKSKTRTEILLVHAERIYKQWSSEGHSKDERLMRRVIHMKYILKQSFDDIMDATGKSKNCTLCALNNALSELSVQFFGVDGEPGILHGIVAG